MTTDGAPRDLSTLARGGSLNFAGSAGGAVATMALVLVVTKGLGADSAGALFEAIALFNIAIVVSTLGADTGLLRFTSVSLSVEGRSLSRRALRVAVAPVALVSSVIAVVGITQADVIGRRFGGAGTAVMVADYVRILSVFVPIGALALVLLGGTRGYGTMVPTVVAERLGRPVIQLLAAAVAVAMGADAGIVALAWAMGVVVSFEVSSMWLARLWSAGELRRIDQALAPLPTIAHRFWSFTLPRALASISRVAVLWLDVLLIGALISPAAAAIYTVATRLLQAGFLAVEAVGQAVEPLFASVLAGGRRDGARSLYEYSTSWLVALTWPLFFTMWIFAPTILGVFGAEFRDASTVVAILAGSALLGSGLGPVDVLLVMAGKSMWSFRNSSIACSLNVALNVALIPALGLNGAAIAWAVSRVVGNVLPLVQVRSLLGLHPFGQAWFSAAAAATLAFGVWGVVVRVFFGDGVIVMAGYLAVGAAVYTGLLWRARSTLHLSEFSATVRRRRQPVEGVLV